MLSLNNRAELLRRAQIAQRQAARGVAGPAPPMSWRDTSATTAKKGVQIDYKSMRKQVEVEDLQRAADFFSASPSARTNVGADRLLEHCLRAVLGYLESEIVISDLNEPAVRLGDVMREQAGFLDTHIIEGLMRLSSLLPLSDPRRLTDHSMRALLGRPESESNEGWDGNTEDDAYTKSDWDEPSSSLISHLPLTLHPAPISMLRQLNHLPSLALTSLNLAYSTISNLDVLVRSLPVALRELSLCGMRMKSGTSLSDHDVNRALGVLALKLIVLKVSILHIYGHPVKHCAYKVDVGPVRIAVSNHTLDTCLYDLPVARVIAFIASTGTPRYPAGRQGWRFFESQHW